MATWGVGTYSSLLNKFSLVWIEQSRWKYNIGPILSKAWPEGWWRRWSEICSDAIFYQSAPVADQWISHGCYMASLWWLNIILNWWMFTTLIYLCFVVIVEWRECVGEMKKSLTSLIVTLSKSLPFSITDPKLARVQFKATYRYHERGWYVVRFSCKSPCVTSSRCAFSCSSRQDAPSLILVSWSAFYHPNQIFFYLPTYLEEWLMYKQKTLPLFPEDLWASLL